MFSRLATRAALPRLVLVRAASTSQTNSGAAAAVTTSVKQADIFENEKGAERDLVNFPRRKRPIDISPVRHLCIPEEWFTFFHQKTGVTGPYMFGIGLTTFLASKEIWVLEHEFYTGLALFTLLGVLYNKVGPSMDAALTKMLDDTDAGLKAIKQDEINRCKSAIKEEETAQWMGTSYESLIEAKKESVALQLEAEYRTRLQDAYLQVKKRLDYQLETANVMRSSEQKHMVGWIIDNVRKSITAKQEEDILKKCIADLKGMSA